MHLDQTLRRADRYKHWFHSLITFQIALGTCVLQTGFQSDASNVDSRKDLHYLKKLLLLKKAEAESVPKPIPPSGTLVTPVSQAELSAMIALTTDTPLVDEFYNTIFRGNGALESDLRSAVMKAVPSLRTLQANTTDRLSKQRALVELAVQMQPLIRPLMTNHPNLTAKVTALGETMNTNRTARGEMCGA